MLCDFRDRFGIISLHDVIKVSYLCVAVSILESVPKNQGFVCFTLFGGFGCSGGFGFGRAY